MARTKQDDEQLELLAPTPAAAALGCNVGTLYRLMGRGDLQYTQTPRGRRIRRRDVDALAARRLAIATIDDALERVLRDAIASGALPQNPSGESLARVARILSDSGGTR